MPKLLSLVLSLVLSGIVCGIDSNGNGLQDTGELGLSGVTVRLLNGSGTLITSMPTDSSGNYKFVNPDAGSYIVEFVPPSGWVFTPKGQGSDQNNDSNANPGTGRTDTINLVSGENDLTIDAGLYEPGHIGDRVWDDTNENGVQDPGEPGLSGVTVNLYQVGNPTPVATDVTDNSGIYGFDNLAPGQYYIEVVAPTGYFNSPKGQGGNPANDSNINPGTSTTDVFVVASGTNDNTVDSGVYKPVGPTPTPTITPTATPTPIGQPNVGITKRLIPSSGSEDGIVVVGRAVSYVITVINTGNTALVTVPLEDIFDATYLGYVNAIPVPDVVDNTNGKLRWNDITGATSMLPGESKVLAVTFITKKSTDLLSNKQTNNVGKVTGVQDDKGTTLPDKQDQAPVRITNLAVGISKRTTSPANGVVTLNGEVVFTIRVENKGDTTLVKIPVQDTYEANILQFVRTNITTPSVNTNGNNGTLNWADITTDLGDLAPGAFVEFTVTFRLIALSNTVNTAATGIATDENGDKVNPVSGQSPANVIAAGTFKLFAPVLLGQPASTPTPTPVPTPGGQGEPECPPAGCPVPNLIHPKGIAVHEAQQMIYVSSRDTDTLIKYNPSTNQVVATVPTGDEPWDVVINESANGGTGEIYVSNFASGDVWVYNATTLAVIKKIEVGENPALMEIFPDINTVAVVVRRLNSVAIIQDHNVVQYVSSGGTGPYGLASDQVNKQLIVTNRDTGNAWIIYRDGSSWRLNDRSEMKDYGNTQRTQPFAVEYNPNNKRIYITYMMPSGKWYVDVIEKNTMTDLRTMATIRVGDSGSDRSSEVGGTGMVINPATNNLFVNDTAAGTVTVIGPANTVVATLAVGVDPYEISLNHKTQTLYITLRVANSLAKVADGF